MRIIQAGVPKSGNFWLYQILQQILIRSGNPHQSFIQQQPIYQLAKEWKLNYPDQARIDVLEIHDTQHSYRISGIYRMPLDNLEEYAGQTNHVWTHSPVCKRTKEVFSLFDKKIYIIRDPRDLLISASKYFTSAYMRRHFYLTEDNPELFLQKNLERLMLEWVWHVYDYIRLSETEDIHIIFYEDLLLNFQQELKLLLKYLQLDLSSEQRENLQEDMSFKELKKQNSSHLRKGKSGYWKDQLNEDQLKRVTKIADPLIRFLGYPQSKNEEYEPAKKFPHQNYEMLREKIINSQMEVA